MAVFALLVVALLSIVAARVARRAARLVARAALGRAAVHVAARARALVPVRDRGRRARAARAGARRPRLGVPGQGGRERARAGRCRALDGACCSPSSSTWTGAARWPRRARRGPARRARARGARHAALGDVGRRCASASSCCRCCSSRSCCPCSCSRRASPPPRSPEREIPALWWARVRALRLGLRAARVLCLRLRAGGLKRWSRRSSRSPSWSRRGWLVWLSRDVDGAHRQRARGRRGSRSRVLALWLGARRLLRADRGRCRAIVQKIFYVHIPAIIPTYLGFVLTAIGGVGYLRTRARALGPARGRAAPRSAWSSARSCSSSGRSGRSPSGATGGSGTCGSPRR